MFRYSFQLLFYTFYDSFDLSISFRFSILWKFQSENRNAAECVILLAKNYLCHYKLQTNNQKKKNTNDKIYKKRNVFLN